MYSYISLKSEYNNVNEMCFSCEINVLYMHNTHSLFNLKSLNPPYRVCVCVCVCARARACTDGRQRRSEKRSASRPTGWWFNFNTTPCTKNYTSTRSPGSRSSAATTPLSSPGRSSPPGPWRPRSRYPAPEAVPWVGRSPPKVCHDLVFDSPSKSYTKPLC